ncbi:MAG: hypothetical protein AB1483_12920 [Candidatus Zixiibacteriota bacterium]
MRGAPVRSALLAGIISIFLISSITARTNITLVGEKIPSRYFIGSVLIFDQSDSLYLNAELLVREVDYRFDSRRGAFDLSGLEHGTQDTLRIVYTAVPSWLRASYGTTLPEATSSSSTPAAIPSNIVNEGSRSGQSDISISGAKTFRFTTRSEGASDFSQSLDMKISGRLSPGLELSGNISDRGYDPSYGTANSRLSELDKLNLKLSSDLFVAQVGDIVVGDAYFGAPSKQVSGASFDLRGRAGHFNAAAARPKGRFETVSFFGRDGTQGPYQISSGTAGLPIVPGSETVWLDGELLERGANKDYIVDYPTGRITFNVNHPIDERSRIECDYEPLLSDFKGELYSTGGGVSAADSSVNVSVGWLREGDDKNEPLIGELSQSDLSILEMMGDNLGDAVRSGVIADSLGDYVIVPDSLPDTVYQYVGDGEGDYSVGFSYFGQGQGDYVFLGGSQYRFVGEGNGEYRPLVKIPAPQRTDYYQSKIELRDILFSSFMAKIQQSKLDRNLLSDRNDGDNEGLYYLVEARRDWRINNAVSDVSLTTSRKEANFSTRERLYAADFRREYMLPEGFVGVTDEVWHDARSTLRPSKKLVVSPFYSRLDYEDSLTSRRGGVSLGYELSDREHVSAGWKTVRSDLEGVSPASGEGDVYNIGLAARLARSWNLSADFENDRRRNSYSGEMRGTRYSAVRTTVSGQHERLTHEYFVEDSLSESWQRQLERNRLSGSSNRRLGDLSYGAMVTYQWLSRPLSDENSLLSRVSFNYSSSRRQLGFGASYAISEETRNSRGITYLEVQAGEGDYVLENGEYVPDPDGNYIRVEETLSQQARVRRGEKSFHFNKVWSAALLRLNSGIEEELLADGSRNAWWVVPFWSDRTQPYLFYIRRWDADFRIIPIKSGHAVNFSYNEDREIRDIAGAARERNDFKGAVTLKQTTGKSYFEQAVEMFRNDRDSYYSGGGVIEGYRLSAGLRQQVESNELSGAVSYRRADAESGERSKIYSASASSRIQVVQRGELRSSVEVYHQTLDNLSGEPSFLLTDNRPGKDGAIWSVSLRYGIKGGMRVNFSLSGRHSDDRTARVTGRGEFVAGF